MASPRYDPNVAELIRIFDDPKKEEEFLRQLGLSATPNAVRPPRLESAPGRPSNNEYWGICKDIKFNPSFPDCVGQVVTYQRKTAKGHRPQFRCSGCRKQLSQLNGSNVLRGLPGQGSFFAFTDRLGRPNVRLTRKEIMWLAFSLCKDMPVALTKELMRGEFCAQQAGAHRLAQPPTRGCARGTARADPLGRSQPGRSGGRVPHVGKRKGNRGRLLTGDGVTRSTVDQRAPGSFGNGPAWGDKGRCAFSRVDARGRRHARREKLTQKHRSGYYHHSDDVGSIQLHPQPRGRRRQQHELRLEKQVNHTNILR
ncbi:hypothetical protein HPB48_012615 [Haemaphysalis longicornis]|uniref:Uncharacterized protein n=1 Tax=Haemaphysalis longicornis TaxID=44386 RepID=A0A9J6G067_HAELO|nr:hypothetical protein HPB48_012615 [Haemaphysalis longicornis]